MPEEKPRTERKMERESRRDVPTDSPRRGLVRESVSLRPRTGRVERARGLERDESPETREPASEPRARRSPEHSGRRGRPPLVEELGDLNRGGAYVAVESVAIAMDVFSKVLRNAVDRAFDEDYSSPGDMVRGLTSEADLAVYDLADELRTVPRRLDHRFEDALRSPRAARGERNRREEESWEKTRR